MTRPPSVTEYGDSGAAKLDVDRPSKRFKCDSQPVARQHSEAEHSLAVPLHPLRVRPSGNAYTTVENLKSNIGTLATLPDELLLQILEYLQAPALLRLGATCKALHAFSRAEELWKALLVG